ncbi:tRNA-dihydrouridine(20a/20b) synthase [NAD(P)+]-like [Acropora cervicornis]|uniref:tRNA-dihydrouridine(20a/20b) synthase [NAD(P)+]-like n=1 Tax=Acropora cervicornis TaxID=6130 RepID=A0AAD9VEK6_ACRCE|nr:tRNA-dihydrouridine(20a/20b) synthase [NAD(P)+]-like [Acropora cervicornis]
MADPNEESHRECFIYEKPLQLFEEKKVVRMYGCDLVFTPMIVADCFVKSVKARDMEFTTNAGDRPLVVQFAANNARDFADAAELVAPWALQEGYGAKLINNPELIKDIVRKTTCRIPGLPVSIKIRIHENLSVSVPVVANGDIKSEADVRTVYEKTGVNERRVFSELKSTPAVLNYLNEHYDI